MQKWGDGTAVVVVLFFRTSRRTAGRDYAAPKLQSATQFTVNVSTSLTLRNFSGWFISVEIRKASEHSYRALLFLD